MLPFQFPSVSWLNQAVFSCLLCVKLLYLFLHYWDIFPHLEYFIRTVWYYWQYRYLRWDLYRHPLLVEILWFVLPDFSCCPRSHAAHQFWGSDSTGTESALGTVVRQLKPVLVIVGNFWNFFTDLLGQNNLLQALYTFKILFASYCGIFVRHRWTPDE